MRQAATAQPAMSWTIEYEDARGSGAPFGLSLLIRQPGQPNRLVGFIQADADADNQLDIAASLAGLEPGAKRRALVRWATRTLEARLRSGLLQLEGNFVWLRLESEDISAIVQLGRDKTCDYQARYKRDIYCSVAKGDETAAFVDGPSTFAPTSRKYCRECDLPDTDFLCSHLLTPKVNLTRIAGPGEVSDTFRRKLFGALCDLGSEKLGTGSKCYPGGNACWQRVVEPQEPVAPLAYDKGSLTHALDFLGAVWRLKFGKDRRLILYRGASSTASLESACASREEFESRLSSLDDTLKLMEVPDDLIGDESIEKNQTLKRLDACLRQSLESDEMIRARNAISKLSAINDLRNAKQHTRTKANEASAFNALGISLPKPWGECWDAVRAKATEALTVIAQELNRQT